jgi:ribonuclease D
MSEYKVLFGVEHLGALASSTCIAFDTETLQLQPEVGKLRLIQLGCSDTKTIVVIDCFDLDEDDWDKVSDFFNINRRWLAHNAVFDLGWLQEHSVRPRGQLFCTMLASKLLSNGLPNVKHGLAHVAKRYLRIEVSKEQQASNWGATDLSEEQLVYAAKDVEVLLELDVVLQQMLAKTGLAGAVSLECRALPAMAQMWRTGLPWNLPALEQLRDDYQFTIDALSREFLRELDTALPEGEKLPREVPNPKRLSYLRDRLTEMGHDDDVRERWYAEIEEIERAETFNLRPKASGSIRLGTKQDAGFNLNSPKQLLQKFTALLGEPPVDGKTGKPSASRAALQEYAAGKRRRSAAKWLNQSSKKQTKMVLFVPAICSLERNRVGCPASSPTTNRFPVIRSFVNALKLLMVIYWWTRILVRWNYDSLRQWLRTRG